MSIVTILVVWGIIILPFSIVVGKMIETADEYDEDYW